MVWLRDSYCPSRKASTVRFDSLSCYRALPRGSRNSNRKRRLSLSKCSGCYGERSISSPEGRARPTSFFGKNVWLSVLLFRGCGNERDDPQGAAGTSRDLHWQSEDPGAGLGYLVEVCQILQAGNSSRAGHAVNDEILRGPVVDGSGV